MGAWWRWLTGESAGGLLVRAGIVVVVATGATGTLVVPGTGLVAVLPAAAFGLLTVAAGRYVDGREDELTVDATDLVWWGLLTGPIAVLVLGLWYGVLAAVYGRTAGSLGIALTSVAVGVLVGGIGGWYAALSRHETATAAAARTERERVEREREVLATMDSLLRHHLLNSLNVVRGTAQLVETETDDETTRGRIGTVLDRTETMEEVIVTARQISETMLSRDEPLEETDLTDAATAAVERVRESRPDSRIAVEADEPVGVLADDLLVPVVVALVENAVVHGAEQGSDGGDEAAIADGDPPRDVAVRVERRVVEVADVDPSDGVRAGGDDVDPGDEAAVLTVVDGGPGLTAEEKRRAFDPSWHGMDSEGEGLGLFLVRTVVEKYGGAVSLADRDPTGTVVRVVLPPA